MKNAVYWIALQNILGYGSIAVSDVVESFENVADLFDKSLKRSDVKFLNDKCFKKLKSFDLKKAQAIIEYCD